MGRFSPGYKSEAPRYYERMETGLADAIAGAENLIDTRQRQDKRAEQDDKRIATSERYAGVAERQANRSDAEAQHGWGYHPDGRPQESVQTPNNGQGSTVPPVGGMPTIEGQGTPAAAVRGSGVVGDLGPNFSGGQPYGSGKTGYWIDPGESMKERKERELMERMMAEDERELRESGYAERDVGAIARGYESHQSLAEQMMQQELGGGSGAQGSPVSGTSLFNRENEVLDSMATQRAIEIIKSGGNISEAIREAQELTGGFVDVRGLIGIINDSGEMDRHRADFIAEHGVTPEYLMNADQDRLDTDKAGKESQAEAGVGQSYRTNLPPDQYPAYGTPQNRR